MKMEEKASISIMKIICISIILILISGIGVMAVSTNSNDVKIVLENGYEMQVKTSKTNIAEILKENNIVLAEDEKVIPSEEKQISSGEQIKIVKKTEQEVQITKIAQEGVQTNVEELLKNNYAPIIEKIVKEQEPIPFETITKESGKGDETTNKVLKEGKEGIKEITYKIKYQNDVEIEKTVISEKVIKQPVNKIIQVKKITSRSTATPRTSTSSAKVPQTGNTTRCKVTAYCSCPKCCGKSNGITASGKKAAAGRTIAASSKYKIGTKLNVGGHIYTVEDRGGAVNGNHIDIYVNSHSEALAWGVKYLPVSVAE